MSQPLAFPKFRAFDHSTGAPLAGGLVNFYVTRTTTRQSTFTDATLAVPNSNPVVLDANGEANIWLSPTGVYTIVLTDSVGAVQWTVDDVGSPTAAQSLSGNNLLLNGGMEIWQENVTYVGANNLFVADGWAINLNTSGGAGAVTDYTITRQAAAAVNPGSQFSLRVQRNAASVATRQAVLVQNIETLDSYPMQGNTFVLSFKARIGANFSPALPLAAELLGGTGTDESFQTGLALTGQTGIGFGTFTPTTSFQTFTLPMNSTVPGFGVTEFSVAFLLGVCQGTAGAADWIEIDDVKLELGIAATPGVDGPADYSLRRCERRYYKSFPQNVVPAQGIGSVNGAYVFPQVVGAGVANQITASLPIPAWMRNVAGTLTTYNPNIANAQIRNTTVAADCAGTAAAVTPNEAHIVFTTAAGSAAGNENRVQYTLDKRF